MWVWSCGCGRGNVRIFPGSAPALVIVFKSIIRSDWWFSKTYIFILVTIKNSIAKGGVIKYETDRGGMDFNILLKNLVAQHKQQKEFPGPTVSSKKFHGPLKLFHYEL